MRSIQDNIKLLLSNHSDLRVLDIDALPRSGSSRQYFRASTTNGSFIATWSDAVQENNAFFAYTEAMKSLGIRVPDIMIMSDDHRCYIQKDLGSTAVLDWIFSFGNSKDWIVIEEKYRSILTDLIQIQDELPTILNVASFHSHHTFDVYQVQWDLNYFKYNFLKVHIDPIDEWLLEREFDQLKQWVIEPSYQHFMYRDFQARNIMMHENELYYIDYQGGKLGPALYDVVSLLFQAKANLPESIRESLLDFYIQQNNHRKIPIQGDVHKQFWNLALIRCLQVLGAYGFRGYLQGKTHFKESIPQALQNLTVIMDRSSAIKELPYLKTLIHQLYH